MKKIHRFTLVELLAVMAIIAILSGIGFGAYTFANTRAKESATESLLKQIEAGLGDRARFAAAHSAYLRPAAVACLAARDADRAVDYLTLQPLYLRVPQAERERARREAAHD